MFQSITNVKRDLLKDNQVNTLYSCVNFRNPTDNERRVISNYMINYLTAQLQKVKNSTIYITVGIVLVVLGTLIENIFEDSMIGDIFGYFPGLIGLLLFSIGLALSSWSSLYKRMIGYFQNNGIFYVADCVVQGPFYENKGNNKQIEPQISLCNSNYTPLPLTFFVDYPTPTDYNQGNYALLMTFPKENVKLRQTFVKAFTQSMLFN